MLAASGEGIVVTSDNIKIYYKDWGPREAQPIVFHHGWPLSADDDQIVPIDNSAKLAITYLTNGTLKIYPGLPHGMCSTHADVINPDLLAFIAS